MLVAGALLIAVGGGAAYVRLEASRSPLSGPTSPSLSGSGAGRSAPQTGSDGVSGTTAEPSVLGVEPPVPGVPEAIAEPVEPAEAGTARAAAVRRALQPGLADPALGPHVVARVADLSGGAPLLSAGRSPVVPASTLKLLTTAAALEVLGPDHEFATRVVQGPGNQIVLVGGGDPLLTARPAAGLPAGADLQTLAAATADALTRGSRVRLRYDDSLFTGPRASPRWEPDYLPDGVVSPISALWVDEGRPPTGYGRVDDPPAAAAAVFARALSRRGIVVVGPPRPGPAPAAEVELAGVTSAPLEQIVEHVLQVSDNEAAEVLLRHVGLEQSGAGSFAGGVAGVRAVLGSLGVPLRGARLYDGSGLSRADRLDPDTLVELLRVAADPAHPELRAVLTGLPVAGATGSLTARFADGARTGRGLVRAKTGTLTGVSGLAGLVTDRTGETLVFVLVADRFRVEDTLAARAALDRLAASLASCRCGAG
jgi:D-alanyl-D-alanine carboxypeptidase/D-alanyl-D-alanine-endopeptidase (penicillin-binding protein 4)